MAQNRTGALFSICRAAICWRYPYRFVLPAQMPEPAVYVVHHQNLRGPLLGMAWFPFDIRPWVLNVFFSQRACFDQYYHYTFTQRLKIPKVLAAVLAWPLSFFVSSLMHSMRAIPVHRDSAAVITTFRESVKALLAGESLLLAPDIDYADDRAEVGDLYDGFLDLERFYQRKTGHHLPFIPLQLDHSNRQIVSGKPLYFPDTIPFQKAKPDLYQRLKDSL
jgi:1-acyl-sn-glycerol-3-phosphate acyltransferase